MGIKGIPIPYGVPVANSFCERFIGSLKRECLDHFVFFSERHLLGVVSEYVAYHNEARPHQGIGAIPKPANRPMLVENAVKPRKLKGKPILGGLHHDHRLAA
jgi:putative transposase